SPRSEKSSYLRWGVIMPDRLDSPRSSLKEAAEALIKALEAFEEPDVADPATPSRAICLGGGGPAAGLHIGALDGLQKNNIKFSGKDSVWALSCIGAWVGVIYNQADRGREIEETYKFFRNIFRDDKIFESFPVNTIFAPDLMGNTEALLSFLANPKHYLN